MTDLEIYMWEPCLSPHKLDLFEALRLSTDVRRVVYVAAAPLPPERAALGWTVVQPPGAQCVLEPSEAEAESIIARSAPDAVHIFSGMHNPSLIVAAIGAALRHKRRFGLMHEPRAFEGWKGWARFAHSWATEGRLRTGADFVLAIGANGPPWFSSVGFNPAKIFPFAYFLPFQPAPPNPAPSNPVPRQPRVNYLGRLTDEKGFGVFLAALPLLRTAVAASVAGAGPGAAAARALESGGALSFRGVLPMDEVPGFLAQTDILAAPSRSKDDGWCAVVSEALMQGAAVVATDRVGGSICLHDPWRGRVVAPGSPQDLARAVDDLIESGQLHEEPRTRRVVWARGRLTGAAGARYLLAILAHLYEGAERPRPFYEDDPRLIANASSPVLG